MQTIISHSEGVRSVSFSPNDKVLASGGNGNTIKIWDVSSGENIFTLRGHENSVVCVEFHPSGNLLASGGDDGVCIIWNVHTGERVHTLVGPNLWVRSISFSYDGKILASAGADSIVRLWDVQTGVCLNVLKNDRPYEGMDITGVKGLSSGTIATLKALGAVENDEVRGENVE